MSNMNNFSYTISTTAGTSGPTTGFAAWRAAASSEVKSMKERRYSMREGRCSREDSDMCCMILIVLGVVSMSEVLRLIKRTAA